MSPASTTAAPEPDPVRAIAQLADALGHASTGLFNYRRDNPNAANLEQVLNLELSLDRRAIELRTQAVRVLGEQAAQAIAGLQQAAQRVDAFLAGVKTMESRLSLASSVIALASATLVGDAGGILTAVVAVHAALDGAA
jgi:hypothetical protein